MIALGLALRASTAARLLSPLGREVIDFIGIHVQNDLASPCVRVPDRHGRRILLVDLIPAEIAHQNRLPGHLHLSFDSIWRLRIVTRSRLRLASQKPSVSRPNRYPADQAIRRRS